MKDHATAGLFFFVVVPGLIACIVAVILWFRDKP